MPGLNLPPAEMLSKTPGIASLFSSLNAALGGGLPGADLFSSLLAQTNTSPVPSLVANAGNTGAIPPADSNSGKGSGVFTSLQDVVSAWRGFVNKWQSHQNASGNAHDNDPKQQAAGGTKSNANAGSHATTAGNAPGNAGNGAPQKGAPANNDPATGTGAPATATAPATAPAGGDASTQNDPANSNAPPSLSDLLAELQAILQTIQQQIQNAQSASKAGAAPDPSALAGDNSTSDPANNGAGSSGDPKNITLMSAADMLMELLLLTRFAEKKLDLNQDQAAQSTAAATTAAAPDLAQLDAQLKANLKALLDDLKTNVAANDNAGAIAANDADAANAANASATANGLAVSAFTPASVTPAATSAAPEIIKQGLAVANDFLQQLNTLFSAPAAPAVNAALLANTAAGTNSGAGFDSSQMGDEQNAPAGTAGTPNNAAALTAGDGAKGSNPYSFASQLSAARATNGGTTGLPSAVEQVMLQLSRNVKNGNDQMTLQLQPAELGRIDIKLSFSDDGKVQGTVMANNPVTLDLLLKDVRGLERALQDAGLSADPGSLQFSLGGQSGNTSGQMPGNNSSGNSPSSGGTPADDAAAIDPTSDAAETWYITPGRVNLQV